MYYELDAKESYFMNVPNNVAGSMPFIVARYINYVGGFYVSSNACLMIHPFRHYSIFSFHN
ncbi:MAG: hypothetical protein K2Y14_09425 [Burkholderiales bacterium]|nr:hypothetical protein [Burkholderiales bacterium]